MDATVIGTSRSFLRRVSAILMLLAFVGGSVHAQGKAAPQPKAEDSRDHRVRASGPHAVSAANRGRGENAEVCANNF